ncbi:uncharacterized protein FRV6_13613 [Fusarium oxysporum]|nr:uncharacterized protein FRV6_13613 [Fusarium oxysporum]
MAIRAG